MTFPILAEIGDDRFATDPTHAYRAAHASEGPGIFAMPNGDGLVVTSYELLNTLKAHPDLQAQNRVQRKSGSGAEGALARLSGRGPFFMNEPEHSPTAIAVYRPMSPSQNDSLIVAIESIANEAMDAVLDSDEPDLVRDYAVEIASKFWLQFLGVPSEMRDSFARWSAAIVPMLGFERTDEQIAAANASAEEMWAYLRQHYMELQNRGSRNVFHMLGAALAASDVHGVPDNPADPIAAMTFDGIDSVATATANVLYTCLRHPDEFAAVRQDRDLLASAWRESMRFEPSLLGLHRAARKPIDLTGITIPSNVNILMLWASGNRDPRAYDEPDRFNIRRDNRRFLAFGGGVRICKGRHLAMLQAEIALRVLLERTRSVELAGGVADWGRPGLIRAIQSVPVRIKAN